MCVDFCLVTDCTDIIENLRNQFLITCRGAAKPFRTLIIQMHQLVNSGKWERQSTGKTTGPWQLCSSTSRSKPRATNCRTPGGHFGSDYGVYIQGYFNSKLHYRSLTLRNSTLYNFSQTNKINLRFSTAIKILKDQVNCRHGVLDPHIFDKAKVRHDIQAGFRDFFLQNGCDLSLLECNRANSNCCNEGSQTLNLFPTFATSNTT